METDLQVSRLLTQDFPSINSCLSRGSGEGRRGGGERERENGYPILGVQPMFGGLTLFQYLGYSGDKASTPVSTELPGC